MAESPLPIHAKVLTELDAAWREPSAGARLEAVRRAAPRLRDRIVASGKALSVRTFDNASILYPTTFGLSGLAMSPSPYLVMTNRANLVVFRAGGETKTLLFNPTDVERSAQTPFFVELRKKLGELVATRLVAAYVRPALHAQLAGMGFDPADVDYVAFDHLHTQDLREILGTDSLRAYYPRAKLLVWRPELELVRVLHPLQRPWYIDGALAGVADEKVVACDGDLLLGDGVALVRTPGHTVGNWSLVLSTDRGLWTVSENAIASECWAPETSRIPGVAKGARKNGLEVVLNANTLEMKNEQYTSMLLEKALADRVPDAPEIPQCFPSSELTATPVPLGVSPSFVHGGIEHGPLVLRPRAHGGAATEARSTA